MGDTQTRDAMESGPARRLAELLDQLDQESSDDLLNARVSRRRAIDASVWVGQPRGRKPVVAAAESVCRRSGVPITSAFDIEQRGWALDLSVTGIGMVLGQPVAVGSTLLVSIQSLMPEPLLLPARITACRQVLPHAYRVGAAFIFEDSGPAGEPRQDAA